MEPQGWANLAFFAVGAIILIVTMLTRRGRRRHWRMLRTNPIHMLDFAKFAFAALLLIVFGLAWILA